MIVVTAPTGLIGHQVLQNLLGSGEPVRVIVRDPSRLPAQARERVETVPGSHGDADVVDQAFAGADAVFWLVPPDPHAGSVEAAYVDFTRPACDAFKRHEVRRVVGVSALGRGTAVAGHAGLVTASLAMDDLIAGSGVGYRALTMPSFMDNLLRQAESIKNRGVFVTPISGDRKLPSCATRDIAAVAARLLADDSWSGAGHVAVLGPAGPVVQRHGADHVRGTRQASALPADSRPGPQGQAHRIRDVRRDSPGHGRHDGRQGPGPRQRRTAHPGIDHSHHLPPVVPADPQAGRPRLTTAARPHSTFMPMKDKSPR
jgi:uncharacterized protein YbjT (DUF2867 family)